jgi:hypothetical protein
MPLRHGPGMTKDSIPGLGQHGGELWLSLINYKPGFLDATRRSSLMPVVASSIVAYRGTTRRSSLTHIGSTMTPPLCAAGPDTIPLSRILIRNITSLSTKALVEFGGTSILACL